jgi:hypothetical protein
VRRLARREVQTGRHVLNDTDFRTDFQPFARFSPWFFNGLHGFRYGSRYGFCMVPIRGGVRAFYMRAAPARLTNSCPYEMAQPCATNGAVMRRGGGGGTDSRRGITGAPVGPCGASRSRSRPVARPPRWEWARLAPAAGPFGGRAARRYSPNWGKYLPICGNNADMPNIHRTPGFPFRRGDDLAFPVHGRGIASVELAARGSVLGPQTRHGGQLLRGKITLRSLSSHGVFGERCGSFLPGSGWRRRPKAFSCGLAR